MWLFFLLFGCSDNRPLSDSILWSGFQYEWDILSHRLALVHAELNEDPADACGTAPANWRAGDDSRRHL